MSLPNIPHFLGEAGAVSWGGQEKNQAKTFDASIITAFSSSCPN